MLKTRQSGATTQAMEWLKDKGDNMTGMYLAPSTHMIRYAMSLCDAPKKERMMWWNGRRTYFGVANLGAIHGKHCHRVVIDEITLIDNPTQFIAQVAMTMLRRLGGDLLITMNPASHYDPVPESKFNSVVEYLKKFKNLKIINVGDEI